MKSVAYRILEPIAVAVIFVAFFAAVTWLGLRWVDEGSPMPIAKGVKR